MNLQTMLRWSAAAMIILGLTAGVMFSLQDLNRQRAELPKAVDLSYLPRGEYLKLAVFGYRSIAADFIWLKAVQQFAGRNQTRDGYLAAYHAVDVATDLNPEFVHAYKASGAILSVWAQLPNESVALLTKGVLHNPTAWELPFFLGYDYYYELHDPKNAAKYFQQAAALPDAPNWLSGLAARMTVEAGNPDAAQEFLQRLYHSTADERLREGLVQRMREVESEKRIRLLELAVNQYKDRFGALPKQINDLAAKGILATIPDDPLGGHFILRESDGTIVSTNPHPRLKIYR